MPAGWTPTHAWVADQVERVAHRRLASPPRILRDTTDFMAVDRDDVIDLGGEMYLVTGNEREPRFGLEGEPKFWVKRALSLSTGAAHVVKLAFREAFYSQVGTDRIRCERVAAKEAAVLDLTRGDDRFMQGYGVRDDAGNLVRVIEFVSGTDLLSTVASLRGPHDEYFRRWFPAILRRTIGAIDGIGRLHAAGLCHGDIRNDHILIEHATGRFRWIDFDLAQDGPAFDVWAVGNILHCIVARGFLTFQDVRTSRPDLAGALDAGDSSVFFPSRVMNLRAVYPYVPAALNAVLLRFSAGAPARYDRVDQIACDLRACESALETESGGALVWEAIAHPGATR